MLLSCPYVCYPVPKFVKGHVFIDSVVVEVLKLSQIILIFNLLELVIFQYKCLFGKFSSKL